MVVPPTHPLDRPAWAALTTCQAYLAQGAGGALRYDPAFAAFAATADRGPESLGALRALLTNEATYLLEVDPVPPPGATVVSAAPGVQMTAPGLSASPDSGRSVLEPLQAADAPAMFALARLTEPGPFFARTHELGDFLGIKADGRLVAMAGERMKADGFTEVSGVCTHPDHRGHGYAAALTLAVSARILARGETPFLHAYASNTGAIALYRRLGFTVRREVTAMVLTRTGP